MGPADAPRYRTGAVARMLRMPAATLRIWERRHAVVAPATTASGHRLYTAADVQRLAMLRQLTSLGHPIGSLAGLDAGRLREVASTHATTLTRPPDATRQRPRPWRIVAVGTGAEHRLQRPALQLRLERPLQVVAAFAGLDAVPRRGAGRQCDALVVFVDGLQASSLVTVQAAARTLRAGRTAVVFSFAPAPAARAFRDAGIALLREPADDDRLALWLGERDAERKRSEGPGPLAHVESTPPLPFAAEAPPRRYDDATLADFAGLSSTIACECPRHVAEIVMQLSHFESYSAQCHRLDPTDAALHAYLGQVAAAARSLFESALERVAIHEGLVLP